TPGRGAPDEILNEAQFFRDGRRKDEGIEIGSPDRPIDAVHRDDERRPGVKNLRDASVDVRIEIDASLVAAFPVDRRLEADPEGVGPSRACRRYESSGPKSRRSPPRDGRSRRPRQSAP